MATRPHTRPALTAATAAVALAPLLLLPASPARGVILHSTGDPAANSTAPTDPALVNSGWQYQGQWSAFLGTAIAPEYFITAAHVGGGVGGTFVYNNVNHTTVRFADGADFKAVPGTDLRIWRVSTPFASYAPLYNASGPDGSETGKSLVVFGRGTQRGDEVTVGGVSKGWAWGADDHLQRWGENKVAGFADYSAAGDSRLLKFTFDAPGNTGYVGPNEAALSRNDSGGGVFINVGGTWKLAGINLGVYPLNFSYTAAGPSFGASLFDIGGMYYQGAGGTLVQQPDSLNNVPTENYASRVSPSFTAIRQFTNAWAIDANGAFTAPANWANGAPANNSPAFFGNAITAPRAVTLSVARSVASLGFDSAHSYTLSGGGTLTLANSADSTPPRIGVESGNHTVSLNVVLTQDTVASVNPATSTLTFTKPLSAGADVILTKTGAGTLRLPVVSGMALAVNAGTVQIAPNGTPTGTSAPTSLTINGGRLDLADNDLVLEYTGSTLAGSVRQWLLTGYSGGSWTGATGLVSSAAASGNASTALAYAEASDLLGLSGTATANWSGQTVDATSILVKYTYFGDADLNGAVTLDDYALLDRGRALGLTGWINGDFNYDNTIDAADHLLIDRAYALQSGTLSPGLLSLRQSQFGPEYVAQLVASVPEPTALSLLLATPLLLRRRRRA